MGSVAYTIQVFKFNWVLRSPDGYSINELEQQIKLVDVNCWKTSNFARLFEIQLLELWPLELNNSFWKYANDNLTWTFNGCSILLIHI